MLYKHQNGHENSWPQTKNNICSRKTFCTLSATGVWVFICMRFWMFACNMCEHNIVHIYVRSVFLFIFMCLFCFILFSISAALSFSPWLPLFRLCFIFIYLFGIFRMTKIFLTTKLSADFSSIIRAMSEWKLYDRPTVNGFPIFESVYSLSWTRM